MKDTELLNGLRQQLCQHHDSLVEALGQDDTRMVRNAMTNLTNTVKAIAEFQGSVTVEALPANFSTLSRYVP